MTLRPRRIFASAGVAPVMNARRALNGGRWELSLALRWISYTREPEASGIEKVKATLRCAMNCLGAGLLPRRKPAVTRRKPVLVAHPDKGDECALPHHRLLVVSARPLG